ncbi:MAG: hypothetical protein KJI69_03900 [Patescibacteria group bacterium]|nr:hypothetical protein [Patescibacteria group bacterium]
MVERKFKKWQLAFIVGLIFIIPLIVLFQYTKADIVIDRFGNENGCEFISGGDIKLICTYTSDPDGTIIKVTQSNSAWILTGECVTTVGNNFVKFGQENPTVSALPPAIDTLDDCINIIIFEMDNYDREIDFNSETQQRINIFKLVKTNFDVFQEMNMIGG